MANAVITKTGNVVTIICNDSSNKYSKMSYNNLTGDWVALCKNDSCVYGRMPIIDKVGTKYEDFDTVGGANITSNSTLYDELVKLL